MGYRSRSIIVAVSAAVLLAGPSFGRVSSEVKVFDRTVVCGTRIGWISVGGGPRGTNMSHPGQLYVNGDSSGGSLPLAGVQVVSSNPDPTSRGAYLDTKHCSRTTNSVPLTRKGLPAPVAFGADATCPTGGRVLVHLRYTYVPGAHHPYFKVGGRLISASLAVRTYRTLKPVAFAALTAGGRTFQFSTAAVCRT
jgi:hypothetical protein